MSIDIVGPTWIIPSRGDTACKNAEVLESCSMMGDFHLGPRAGPCQKDLFAPGFQVPGNKKLRLCKPSAKLRVVVRPGNSLPRMEDQDLVDPASSMYPPLGV